MPKSFLLAASCSTVLPLTPSLALKSIHLERGLTIKWYSFSAATFETWPEAAETLMWEGEVGEAGRGGERGGRGGAWEILGEDEVRWVERREEVPSGEGEAT